MSYNRICLFYVYMPRKISKERYDEGNKKLQEIELTYCITEDYRDGIIDEMKASKYTVYKNRNQDNKIMFIYNGDFEKICKDMINLGFSDYMENHYVPYYKKISNQIISSKKEKDLDIKSEKKEEVKPQKKEEANHYIAQKKVEEKIEEPYFNPQNNYFTGEKKEKYPTSIQVETKQHPIVAKHITKDDIGEWFNGVVNRVGKRTEEKYSNNPYNYNYPINKLTKKESLDRSIEEIKLKKDKIEEPKYYPMNLDGGGIATIYPENHYEESSSKMAIDNKKSKTENLNQRRRTWLDNLKGCCCPCMF
jgi:hypothetical protein